MVSMTLIKAGTPQEIRLGDSADQARRAADMATAAASIALSASQVAQAMANYRSTIAEAIAAFAVGDYFTSIDAGAVTANPNDLRIYKRIAGPPFYEDQGDAAAPISKATFDAGVGYIFTGGSADDTLDFQDAANDAEGDGVPLVLPPGSQVNFNGTAYLGNLDLRARGAILNCILDGNFTPRGTATRKTKAALMTKSAAGAGYGYSTVDLKFDELNIVVTRTVPDATSVARCGLLLENTSSFIGERINLTATSTTANGECTPLDFFTNNNKVRVGAIDATFDCGLAPSAVWMREMTAGAVSRDWVIGLLKMRGTVLGELSSIFTQIGTVANMEDIWIGVLDLVAEAGGGGQLFSVLDNNGFDGSRFQRIHLGKAAGVIKGRDPAGLTDRFGFKFNNCAPTADDVTLKITGDLGTGLTSMYGIRSVVDSGQDVLPTIKRARVTVDYANTVASGGCSAVFGDMNILDLTIDGEGTGWRHAAQGQTFLPNVKVKTACFTTYALNGVERAAGDVLGPMADVQEFHGNHAIDSDVWDSSASTWQGWFYHSTGFSPTRAIYAPEVAAAGSRALGKIVNLTAAPAATYPHDITYQLRNPGALAVSKDGFSGASLKKRYAAAHFNGSALTVEREGSALSVSSNTITAGASWHQVDTVIASQTLTATANFADGEQFVAGKTYTAKSVLDNVDGHFLIGATLADSITNLSRAINLGAGAGTLYAAATTANGSVSAGAATGTTLLVSATTPGAAGNAIATTTTSTHASWGAATLAGGSDTATLSTITAGAHGQVLTLSGVTSLRTTTVSSTGNIGTQRGFKLQGPTSSITLRYDSTLAKWQEIGRTEPLLRALLKANTTALAVSGGQGITITAEDHVIDTSGGAKTVKLISGGTLQGQMVYLRASTAGNDVTFKHLAAGGNISMRGAADVVGNSLGVLAFKFESATNTWCLVG